MNETYAVQGTPYSQCVSGSTDPAVTTQHLSLPFVR